MCLVTVSSATVDLGQRHLMCGTVMSARVQAPPMVAPLNGTPIGDGPGENGPNEVAPQGWPPQGGSNKAQRTLCDRCSFADGHR